MEPFFIFFVTFLYFWQFDGIFRLFLFYFFGFLFRFVYYLWISIKTGGIFKNNTHFYEGFLLLFCTF